MSDVEQQAADGAELEELSDTLEARHERISTLAKAFADQIREDLRNGTRTSFVESVTCSDDSPVYIRTEVTEGGTHVVHFELEKPK